MKVYLLPDFAKWAKKEKVTYSYLNKTAKEVVNGLPKMGVKPLALAMGI